MIWLAMICAGLMTFAARFSMIGLLGNRPIPERFRKWLAYVAPAVMAAIIAPATLLVDGQLMLADNMKIPALLVAGIVAFVSGNVLLTIGTGMTVLWILQNAF